MCVPLKLLGLGTLLHSFANDNKEVLCEDKGDTLTLITKLLLFMVQKMSKVDMEQLEQSETQVVRQRLRRRDSQKDRVMVILTINK